MSDLDSGYSGSGGEHGRSDARSMPFFPGPPGSAGAPPPPGGTSGGAPGGTLGAPPGGMPLAAPAVAPSSPSAPHAPVQGGRHAQDRDLSDPLPRSGPGPSGGLSTGPSALPGAPPGGHGLGGSGDAVQGRITIEDDVVERIAALAALEVSGVAALGGRAEAGALQGSAQGAAQGAAAAGGLGARPGVRVHAREHEVTLDLVLTVEYGSVIMDVARVVKANVARVVGLMLGTRVAAVNVVVEDVRMPGGGEVRA
ncbi:Asp23/Gls24 family envelope stress response protein [Spirillospora sp. NPDC050679]